MEWILKLHFFILLTLFLLITGCSVGPAYKPPTLEVPEEWKHSQEDKKEEESETLCSPENWWEVFEDEKLNELEAWAIGNNQNLFVAMERVQEARALMGVAAADFYPQITLNPLFTNSDELVKNYNIAGETTATAAQTASVKKIFRVQELYYFLPFNLSYEVDLWGKIRDRYQSAKYSLRAQQKDYEAVMLNLTTSLATAYYQLRTADSQLDLLTKVLKTRQKAFDINQARYEEGLVNYADVTLAGEEVESARIQYNETSRQRDVLEDLIAVLIGVPASTFCLESMPLEKLPPRIPEGIPSEILLRRPDLAEADYRIRSEHALVKANYSELFPSLILTATAGFESPVLKYFLKGLSRFWMNGTQINQVVFDGGRISSNLDAEIARFQEASGAYKQQVLAAFQDVEDALTDLKSYAIQYEKAKIATQWAQKTYELYLDRYNLGVSYYINVADTERDLLNFQENVNMLHGYRYLATIQLIKALGGGW